MERGVSWSLVIPVKRLAVAKSRLRAGLPDGLDAAELMLRMVNSVVRAASACGSVLVVTDDPIVAALARRLGATCVADAPDAGLNPAVAYGESVARRRDPNRAVGALVADLPWLRAVDLAAALDAAAGHARSFVTDAAGTGTVLLCAGPNSRLRPEFGPSSARAHAASGAIPLDGPFRTLRRDADTVADLPAAMTRRRRGRAPH